MVFIPISHDGEMRLGGNRAHGEHQSCVFFTKRYRSVQVLLNPAGLKYRWAGHVAGLLFRPSDDTAYPSLLGQWTGANGPTYDLHEDETILDLVVTTTRPRGRIRWRPSLSQVVDITLITNLREIHLGLETTRPGEQEAMGMPHGKHGVIGARWEFNALFDRVRCIYE